MTVPGRCYRILDVDLRLAGSPEGFFEAFQLDYLWFEVPCDEFKEQLFIEVRGGKNGREPQLCINNTVIDLTDHPSTASFTYQRILSSILEKIKRYTLLHAGVVARNNQAIILAGPSGVGKSTLVMKLLESGFGFMSDDFCPLHRDTALAYPFPRTIWLSPKTQHALGLEGRTGKRSIRVGKSVLMPTELASGVVESPCRPVALIYIDPGAGSRVMTELKIEAKEGCEAPVLTALGRLESITVRRLDPARQVWIIRYPKGAGVLNEIKSILNRHASGIWNACRIETVQPDFNREPEISPMTGHDAAFLQMRELKQTPFLECETGTWYKNSAGFFMELIDLLQDIPCWRLNTGNLDGMQDRVLQVFNDC